MELPGYDQWKTTIPEPEENMALIPNVPGALKFKCPECGGSSLEGIFENAVYSQGVVITENGIDEYYDDVEIEDSDLDRVQCRNCGFVIPAEKYDLAGIIDWLLSIQ